MLLDLQLLIQTTERVFRCEGMLLSKDRSQPLVSFRQLAMLVARQAGYNWVQIGEAFERDPRTIATDNSNAKHHLDKFVWWRNAKADLVDAWDDARQKALENA